MRAQTVAIRPGDDPVLMDVAAMTMDNWMDARIIEDNVRTSKASRDIGPVLANDTEITFVC